MSDFKPPVIFRAKILTEINEVVGAYDGEYRILTKLKNVSFHRCTPLTTYEHEIINNDTLEMSFNNGLNWFTVDDIKHSLGLKEPQN